MAAQYSANSFFETTLSEPGAAQALCAGLVLLVGYTIVGLNPHSVEFEIFNSLLSQSCSCHLEFVVTSATNFDLAFVFLAVNIDCVVTTLHARFHDLGPRHLDVAALIG